jgi:hypothetical protein
MDWNKTISDARPLFILLVGVGAALAKLPDLYVGGIIGCALTLLNPNGASPRPQP